MAHNDSLQQHRQSPHMESRGIGLALPGNTTSLLSIVVPVYNEQDVLPEFHRRLSGVMQLAPLDYEILYVNDGSSDETLRIMADLAMSDEHVAIVDLSRNFGKEIALTAGLDQAQGEAVIIIDADLQDPPEVIPELLAKWRAGYDVVYGQRIARDGETLLKRLTSHVFYRIMQSSTRINIPRDTGDFRLMSRRAVDALLRLREHHRFMKGLFAWVGYSQIAVLYRREPRFAGTTKWNYWRLWNFAIEGFTSFTIAPLKIATYVGLATSLFAFSYGTLIIVKTILYGNPVAGYPSIMVVVLVLGGVQLTALGVIGEYLGRTFDEAKQRPLYLIRSYTPSKAHAPKGSDVAGVREPRKEAMGTQTGN